MTLRVPTGPDGDNHPARPLMTIRPSPQAADPLLAELPLSYELGLKPYRAATEADVTERRRIYFSEDNPNSKFFVTVEGATPTLFHPDNPPAIVTRQGSVEEWTIENRSRENHEFHIHQVHFLLLERNGVPVPEEDRQMLDMVDIPFWTGKGPYPSIKVRLDFRGPDIGDFVYHCHILEHEDKGMMAIVRVIPPTSSKSADPAHAGSSNLTAH
jgi:FtsP/CotA-like multicopper oxidase with cupredoxin domain